MKLTIASFTDLKKKRTATRELLAEAVHRYSPLSKQGLSERAFTLAFSNLVYPQIWEDPLVDIEALDLSPHLRMISIASGGCNILSYLTAAPLHLVAIDLNEAHIALNNLKLTALKVLRNYEDFYCLFGEAKSEKNIYLFDNFLKEYLDPKTFQYWNGRNWKGCRRIEYFKKGFYKYGLLGNYITLGHIIARLLGSNPSLLTEANCLQEQRDIFDHEIRPLLKNVFVRRIVDWKFSLFGLGIPPAQYEALSEGRPMHKVLEERLERLACGFDLKENYFAWQAFKRSYAPNGQGALPPYLERENFSKLQQNCCNVRTVNSSITKYLSEQPEESIDRYSLLDAQDWMTDDDLNCLWKEITRTASPNARVIFRTAGKETILPGRISYKYLSRWTYHYKASAELSRKDRSAIYGGFHLYTKTW
ncbi:MAG: DUF3419 family protein [Hyphomicrobium sp.]